MMKPLMTAAVLALCTVAVPAFVSHSQAAPAKNPYCAMANSQKNPMAWNEYYGCWTTAPKTTHVAAAKTHETYNTYDTYNNNDRYDDPSFCKMANSEKNPVAWDEFYHCWKR